MIPILSHCLVNFTKENIKNFFTFDNLGDIATQSLLVLTFWGTLWGLFKEDALPNGYLFKTLMVVVLAHIFGKIAQLFNLPALVGMISVGFLLVNMDLIGGQRLQLNDKLTDILRHISFVLVLIRAGVEVDFSQVKSWLIALLSLIPCAVETLTVALAAVWLLDFSFFWGLLLGFMLSAVSPAVIVPPILSFKKNGLGIDKGIPSLMIASASIDDVLAVTGVGFCLKWIYKTDNYLIIGFKTIGEPLLGIFTGFINGCILWVIPSVQRLITLIFAGTAADFLFTSTDLRGAGAEACFIVALVAAYNWRKDKPSFRRIQNDLKDIWVIFQPILFGLIGTDVRLSDMEKNGKIWRGLLVLVCGMISRFIATLLVLCGTNLTRNERLFIATAWMPKATIQAALAPLALEIAEEIAEDTQSIHQNTTGTPDNNKNIENAQLVVQIAFLAVIITAPIGAVSISILGPMILTKTEAVNDSSQENSNSISLRKEKRKEEKARHTRA